MEELKQTIKSDINNIINEMKRCKNKKLYYDLLLKLHYLKELINCTGLEFVFPKEYYYEINKNNIDCIRKKYDIVMEDRINYYLDFNKKITKMSNTLNNRYVEMGGEFNLKYIPFNESFKLANDFLKEFDIDIYNHFINLVNSPRFIELDYINESDGFVLRNNYLVDSYTVIYKGYYLADFLSIIHECMHSYNFSLIKNASSNEQDLITYNSLFEVPSFFIEHVGLDYLEKRNIYKGEVAKLRIIFDLELLYFLKEFKKIIDDNICDINEYLNNECYSYGMILSYHFYDNYLKDKNKTMTDLKKFMVDFKNYEKDYMLNNYGLNIIDIINSQKLTKHMDKHLMKVKS